MCLIQAKTEHISTFKFSTAAVKATNIECQLVFCLEYAAKMKRQFVFQIQTTGPTKRAPRMTGLVYNLHGLKIYSPRDCMCTT